MRQQTKNLAISTIISATLLSLAATNASAHLEPRNNEGKEKCYGVVKAHKNDCASKENKHSCAGMAKTDSNPNEWIKLPNGLCEKLIGGSLAQGKQGDTDE